LLKYNSFILHTNSQQRTVRVLSIKSTFHSPFTTPIANDCTTSSRLAASLTLLRQYIRKIAYCRFLLTEQLALFTYNGCQCLFIADESTEITNRPLNGSRRTDSELRCRCRISGDRHSFFTIIVVVIVVCFTIHLHRMTVERGNKAIINFVAVSVETRWLTLIDLRQHWSLDFSFIV